MQVEHVSDGGQGKALPGRYPKALDQAAGEEGVVVVLLGADNADDGSQRTCRGCEEKLWAFAIFLSEDGDQWTSWHIPIHVSKLLYINWPSKCLRTHPRAATSSSW